MPPSPNNPVFFTVAELADRWRVSRQAVERLLEKRKLGSLKIGRGRRVHRDEIARFERREIGHKVARPIKAPPVNERLEKATERAEKFVAAHGQ